MSHAIVSDAILMVRMIFFKCIQSSPFAASYTTARGYYSTLGLRRSIPSEGNQLPSKVSFCSALPHEDLVAGKHMTFSDHHLHQILLLDSSGHQLPILSAVFYIGLKCYSAAACTAIYHVLFFMKVLSCEI